MELKSKLISIKGMHCKSCTIMVTDELSSLRGVKRVKVSLKENTATVWYDDEPTNKQIERAIQRAGYTLGDEVKTLLNPDKSVYAQFGLSIASILIIILIFKNLGFGGVSFSGLNNNKGLMALAIGIAAGLSSCMALVGGLILGLSARYADKHQSATVIQKFKPHLFFNLGRILAFFMFGGILGSVGSLVKISSLMIGLLTIIIGIGMLILGIQLTELFPKLADKGITLPARLSKLVGLNRHKEKGYSPKNAMLLGGITFFLPCGFTQAMQLVAIGSGSAITGSIVMGLFAVGTAPGLLGAGGLASIVKGNFAKIFFRFTGAVVVMLALYNIGNGLNLTGYRLSMSSQSSNNITYEAADEEETLLKTVFTPGNYARDIFPSLFNVEVGKPYKLLINAKGDGVGCMSTIMIPGVLDSPVFITKGLMTLPFKIDKPGTYNITCAMGVVRGKIIATEGKEK